MAIEWREARWGASGQAYDGNRLVGQTVPDVAEAGRTEVTEHRYMAFLSGQRVNGPVETMEEVQALLERAVVS